MRVILRSAVIVAVLALLGGCALSRSVVTLDEAKTPAAPAQSADAPAVKIVEVQDKRTFLLDPRFPDIPSLKDGAITDRTLTARAIARKRGSFGAAAGDVLLPEGDSVANHVRAALADGFRQAGYRVLSPGDAGYDAATPVNAQIVQYWTWLDIGAWVLSLQCESEIQIDTALPALKGTPKIVTTTRHTRMAITESSYQAVAGAGLQSITAKLTEALKANKTVSEMSSPTNSDPS